MRARNFYPAQAVRQLSGEHQGLSAKDSAILKYAMRKSRKFGWTVIAGPAISREAYGAAAGAGPAAVTALQAGASIKVRIFGDGTNGFSQFNQGAV